MKKLLFLLIGIAFIFTSCEKEDNIMVNTHGSVRVDVDITSWQIDSYNNPLLESNGTVYYEIENLGYWTVDYYEVLFGIIYIDTLNIAHIIHDVSNGSDIVGHSTAHGSKFLSAPGRITEVYVEDYSVYN